MAVEGGTQAGPLLGRRREREVFDRLVTDVVTGSSRVLVLRGEPGVGKSALLAHVARRTVGWRVVSAAGVEPGDLPGRSLALRRGSLDRGSLPAEVGIVP